MTATTFTLVQFGFNCWLLTLLVNFSSSFNLNICSQQLLSWPEGCSNLGLYFCLLQLPLSHHLTFILSSSNFHTFVCYNCCIVCPHLLCPNYHQSYQAGAPVWPWRVAKVLILGLFLLLLCIQFTFVNFYQLSNGEIGEPQYF